MLDKLGTEVIAGSEPFLVKDVGVVREVAAEFGVDLGLLGQTAGDGRLTG